MADKVIKAQLLKEYKVLAKKADRRLRELEKISHDEQWKDATRFAYARAMKDIEHRFGEGETRFDKKLPASTKKLGVIAAIKDVERFLEMPSSTKTGLISGYRKRADTLNAKYGFTGKEKLTWKDIAVLFQDSSWDTLTSKMTSGQVWKQIAKRKKEEAAIRKSLKKAVDKNQIVGSDEVMKSIIDNLKSNELDIKDLI